MNALLKLPFAPCSNGSKKRWTRLAASVIGLWLIAVDVHGQTFTTLHQFTGADGNYPYAGIVQGNDGSFYGTTIFGGVSNNGTVFKITSDGDFTTLHFFTGADGSTPYAGLVQSRNGNLYGTTRYGGPSGSFGTVFSMTPEGSLATLHSFNNVNSGIFPNGIMEGSDDNFYGTTSAGGTNSAAGTVFSMTPGGAFTVLHFFVGTAGGRTPYGSLVQGCDSNFYGTCSLGGANGTGTIFRITSAAVFTNLHSFTSATDGASPYAGLVQGSDSNFYGTTRYGGRDVAHVGTVFRITPDGVFTNLYTFGGFADGAWPYGSLVQGSDGNFYGTTVTDGPNGYGTAFRITTNGISTILHAFGAADGSDPYSPLVQGSDGNFYGTTYGCGTNSNYGTVFKITMPTHLLTIQAGGNGTITGATNGWYSSGTNITLLATPDNCFSFSCWQGRTNGCAITGDTITVVMDSARTLGAVFTTDMATNSVPKWWLARYGLTNFDVDAMCDTDGDRIPTWQEYLAGTDPTNPASVLQFTGAQPAPSQKIVVRWASVSNRFYNLRRATNLLAGTNVFVILSGVSNMPATPTENSYTDSVSGVGPYFYRIGVHQ
jgi:uncharacterized repeat protein (TIGR03803 family)